MLVKHESTYGCVNACKITHTIDNKDNTGCNSIGDTAENVLNLSLSDSQNINQNSYPITDSDDTDIEDNLENDVFSNFKIVDKDEENIDNTNNENEHCR